MAKFRLLCGDCEMRFERYLVARPLVCEFCGSEFLAVKELADGPSDDVIARVRKLYGEGIGAESLKIAFELDGVTLDAILRGEYGTGTTPVLAQPSMIERATHWFTEARRKRVLP